MPSEETRQATPCPPRPNPPGYTAMAHSVPVWVKPLSASIVFGGGTPEAENSIGFTADGDIMLYRRLSKEDWDKFPSLYGVDSVWIVYRLPDMD